METENIKVKNLLETVTESTCLLQASGEVDFDFFYKVYQILETFTVQDWNHLKHDLPKWNEKQLDVLVTTLHDEHGDNNKINDNFFIGYIFTISPDNLASNIFDSYLFYFLSENQIKSLELIESIEKKIKLLYDKKYIQDKSQYNFWINYITEIREKAVC